MRRTVRHLTVTAVAAAALLSQAAPANAAVTTRALWNMDRLPTMVDSAGGDNNGSTRNVSQWGGTYGFDGRSSIATVPDKSNLDPGTATIRLTTRFALNRVPPAGDTYDVVRKGYAPTAGGMYKLEIRNSGGRAVAACRFEDGGSGYADVVGGPNLANGGWVEVSCHKTGSTTTVTALGQTRSVSRPVGSISNSTPLYVGGKGDGTDYFPGLIDYVRIDIG